MARTRIIALMRLTINGEARAFDGITTVTALLQALAIAADKVAVERNLEIVPKSTYDTQKLEDGDRIEIVHFIGGG